MPRPRRKTVEPELQLSSMIDVVFLLLIFFILTIKMDENLDDILKLPPAYKSAFQEKDKLQIYILPAVLLPSGDIHPDSTGLIAFTPREPAPWDPRRMEDRYVPLDSVASRLKRERKRAVNIEVQTINNERAAHGKAPLSPEEVEKIRDKIPLMIKADDRTFYGRILQVVAKARSVDIHNFALVTANETSEEYLKRVEE